LKQDQELSDVFLFKLATATKQFKKYKNRIFKEHNINITSDQWILLKNISEAEGINQTELGLRCKKNAAAVTRTLDLLEKKDWIKREADPNSRRVYHLVTTKKGKKIIATIIPIALDVRQQARKGISDKDIKTINKLLDKIFTNLQ